MGEQKLNVKAIEVCLSFTTLCSLDGTTLSFSLFLIQRSDRTSGRLLLWSPLLRVRNFAAPVSVFSAQTYGGLGSRGQFFA